MSKSAPTCFRSFFSPSRWQLVKGNMTTFLLLSVILRWIWVKSVQDGRDVLLGPNKFFRVPLSAIRSSFLKWTPIWCRGCTARIQTLCIRTRSAISHLGRTSSVCRRHPLLCLRRAYPSEVHLQLSPVITFSLSWVAQILPSCCLWHLPFITYQLPLLANMLLPLPFPR